VDGERALATKEIRRAACADCTTPMIAKCGDVKVWHWAHASEQPGCPSAGESEWHLQWKATGLEGTQEIAVGSRRADVLAPGGYAVEFQASSMSGAEVLAREKDWKRKLIWIFDVRQQYANGQIVLRTHPDRKPGDAYRNVTYSYPLERVKVATCRVLLDLDGERLLYVGKWFDGRRPLQGYGWLVSRDWVQINVVRGDRIIDPPGYKVFVNEKELARAALRHKIRYLRPASTGRYEPHQGGSTCLLCGLDHPSCKFTAGSLYCVTGDCANPHHRPAGPTAAEIIAARRDDAFVPYLATGTDG
jgi:hypothetical protein